jgi:hypothetical protein
LKIVRKRRLERQLAPIDRMRERESVRMECLTRMRKARPFRWAADPCGQAVRVLPLAEERMPSHRGLDANLVAFAGVQPHLDE